MKFGGATLGDAGGFQDMISIVQQKQSVPLLIIVSALGSTTRDLHTAALFAAEGSLEGAMEILEDVQNRHKLVLDNTLRGSEDVSSIALRLEKLFAELRTLIRSITVTRQLSNRTLDRVLATGEDASRVVSAGVLQRAGLPVVEIDARSMIVTTSDHGSAEPLTEKSRVRLESVLADLSVLENRIIVTQGFVGATEDGHTTTMGSESSNLTATLLAALLDASEIIIWTDVQGVRSIDPKFSDSSLVRSSLSYEQARCAASAGLKLLYPTMIAPAESAGIPIRIASPRVPNGESTIIDNHSHDGIPVIIAGKPEASTTRITVMFAELQQWLVAVSSLPVSNLASVVTSLSYDSDLSSAAIIVESHHTSTVIEHLHEQLCIKSHVV